MLSQGTSIYMINIIMNFIYLYQGNILVLKDLRDQLTFCYISVVISRYYIVYYMRDPCGTKLELKRTGALTHPHLVDARLQFPAILT